MDRQTLEGEFSRRGPWVTCFHIAGQNFGGNYPAHADHRLQRFLQLAPEPGRILELGCLEGGHSFALSKWATEVVAIDSRSDNLKKARWIQTLLDVPNVQFVQANLETSALTPWGRFDWVFNVGLLYHLPEPWRLLQQIAEVAPRMFLWTHVSPEHKARQRRNGYRGTVYREHGVADPLSGMSGDSFWPTLEELRRMLQDAGFDAVQLLDEEQSHPHGPAVTLQCCQSTVTGVQPDDFLELDLVSGGV